MKRPPLNLDFAPEDRTYVPDLLDAFDFMDKSGHPSRLNYIGCKQKYLPALMKFMPEEFETLTEAYGGMAAVTRYHLIEEEVRQLDVTPIRKMVYNDHLDANVNLFKMIRDEPEELARRLTVTVNDKRYYLHSRAHYDSPNVSDIERAVSYLMDLCHSHHSNQRIGHKSGFFPKKRLHLLPDYIRIYSPMFQHLTIEQLDAFEFIRKYDSTGTLHFVDPIYYDQKHPDTRYAKGRGRQDDAYHRELCEVLLKCEGRVILCGYPTPAYDEMLVGWPVVGPLNKKPPKAKYKPELCWCNFEIDADAHKEIEKVVNKTTDVQ